MQIDKNIKNELLGLDDTALKGIVSSIAKSAGLKAGNINISNSDISKIRAAISQATDKDAEEALKMLGGAEAASDMIEKIKKSSKG